MSLREQANKPPLMPLKLSFPKVGRLVAALQVPLGA